MNTYVNRLAVLGMLALGTASVQAAPYTVAKAADEFGTIQSSGARTANNGNRYWNIGGSGTTYPSTGTLRFYMTDVVAKFDAQFGAGQWGVENIRIVMEHDDASSTSAGSVDVYWFSNDSLAITNGANSAASDSTPGNFSGLGVSPLKYSASGNVLQTVTSSSTNATTIFGTYSKVTTYTFSAEGDGDIDVLGDSSKPMDLAGVATATPNYSVTLPSTVADSTSLLNSELSGSALNIATLAADIQSGTDALSLLYVAGTSTVSATYKGNPYNGLYMPRIYITANAIPEPASLALLALSGGLLIGRRRMA